MWFFIFSRLAAQVFVSAFYEFRLLPLCISVWYSHLSVQEYRQVLQHLFGWNNRFVQTDAEGYAGTLYPLPPLHFHIVFSYQTIYCFYPTVSRFCLQIRSRFLYCFLLYSFFNILQSCLGRNTILILPLQLIAA